MKPDKMKDLVLRACAQDQESWGELYEATAREAYFVARKVCGNEQDAMDMVQDSFITAYEKLESLEDPEKFQSWLNMIVANKCRDFLKKRKPALFSEYETDDGFTLDWADEDLEGMPEQNLDHKETVRLVSEIIDDLPEDQKLCVILYYRDEMSVSEIAEALSVSDGTVKSRLNYARKKVEGKVLELEKRGTKLYGLAPLPFLSWLLRSSTEATVLPAGMSAPVAATAAQSAEASVTGTTAASGAATATATGTGATVATGSAATVVAASKAILGTVAGKVIAGVLAASIAVGGVTATQKIDKKHEQQEAIEMYEELLARGVSENGLEMRYYAHLDLDHDGIPELLVSNREATQEYMNDGELYSYINGELVLCKAMGCYYDYYYLVNGTYLMSRTRKGVEFYNKDDLICTKYDWDVENNDPAPEIFLNGEWKASTLEEIEFYSIMPGGTADGEETFIKTAEPIGLQKNQFAEFSFAIDLEHFSLELPFSWKDKVVCEIGDVGVELFEKKNYEIEDSYGWRWGSFATIRLWNIDEEGYSYTDWPNYCILSEGTVNGDHCVVLMTTPTDVQFWYDFESEDSEEYMEAYLELSNQLYEDMDSVIKVTIKQ